jgi:hypothetical protein
MLKNVTHLRDFALRALDGEIGKVDQFYFDDETWAIRYLVVNTGSWLSGRQVLISPFAVGQADWESKQLEVVLTKKQVEGSPDIDTHKPVSRQHEADHLGYYGYPFYWEGRSKPADSHLRSTNVVTGYHIEANDGEIGHVEDFIIDTYTWAIRYIEVNTRNWWPGKKVLVSPHWIERVSWNDSKIYVDLSRETIKNGPEYVEPVTREYEHRLHDHYKETAYWLQGTEQPYSPKVTRD